MSYFEVVPRGCEVKELKPIERAISIAEIYGKYNCILPTKEIGVCDSWRLVYDGKEYCLYQNNELIYCCDSRDDIASYLEYVL